MSLKEVLTCSLSPAMSSYVALETDIFGGIFSPFHKAHFLSFTFSFLVLGSSIFVLHDVTV